MLELFKKTQSNEKLKNIFSQIDQLSKNANGSAIKLDLSHQKLDDLEFSNIIVIMIAYAKPGFLEELDISHNELTQTAFTCFGLLLENTEQTRLKKLSVGFNKIDLSSNIKKEIESYDVIPKFINNCGKAKKLKHLDLGDLIISPTSAEALANLIITHPKLEIVKLEKISRNLTDNQSIENFIVVLSAAIPRNPKEYNIKLRELTFRDNIWNLQTLNNFCHLVADLYSLEKVDLGSVILVDYSENALKNVGVTFRKLLYKLTSLKELTLKINLSDIKLLDEIVEGLRINPFIKVNVEFTQPVDKGKLPDTYKKIQQFNARNNQMVKEKSEEKLKQIFEERENTFLQKISEAGESKTKKEYYTKLLKKDKESPLNLANKNTHSDAATISKYRENITTVIDKTTRDVNSYEMNTMDQQP